MQRATAKWEARMAREHKSAKIVKKVTQKAPTKAKKSKKKPTYPVGCHITVYKSNVSCLYGSI